MKSLPVEGPGSILLLRKQRQSGALDQKETPELPSDSLILGAPVETAPSKPVLKKEPAPKNVAELKESMQASAEQASAGAVSGFLGHALAWARGVIKTQKFAVGFLQGMRTRAMEISQSPDKVEAHLKAQGLHHDYLPPKNNVNVQLQGKMTIKASMQEFFQLWDAWISQGYGSINDRQYADLVLKFRDEAKNLPLLAHVPMVSEDVFQVAIKDGKMVAMDEVTTASLAGLIPTSKVSWAYRRNRAPKGSNSFEKTIDQHKGDLAAVQRFYQELFDPKRVNPESKATVTFTLEEVDNLDLVSSDKEFAHSVRSPLGFLIPKGPSTLGQQVGGQMTGGPPGAVVGFTT